jgi:hypothetical protein
MFKRPVSFFLLALIPLWPALRPSVHPATPRTVTRPDGTVGRACAPLQGTKAFRREAARCLLAGQGMWIYEFDRAQGGDPKAIVRRMRQIGISYVLIRAGSSKMGFYAQRNLDALLPVAHRAGLKVLVWDFPYFYNPIEDAKRAVRELNYTTASGHRPDGLVPDIEEPAQGVHLSARAVDVYGRELRRRAGPNAILVATTPRPTPPRVANYPYGEVGKHFDAIAPMVYWGYEDPGGAVTRAIERLRGYGLPVVPVGQGYDMRPEGGPGHPSARAVDVFMRRAFELGAPGVSWWSWQHLKDRNWWAIHRFSERHPVLASF